MKVFLIKGLEDSPRKLVRCIRLLLLRCFNLLIREFFSVLLLKMIESFYNKKTTENEDERIEYPL